MNREPLAPGWWVRLAGDLGALEQLAEYFNGTFNVLRADPEYYYATSPGVRAALDPDEARAHGREFLAIACGAVRAEIGELDPPSVDAAVHVDESGQRRTFIAVSAAITTRAKVGARVQRRQPDGSVQVVDIIPGTPRPDEWTALAETNPEVADALAILGRADLRWHDLYHVVGIVRADVGGQTNLLATKWTTRPELSRFTGTANSRAILGREARHGERSKPPTNRMSDDEARRFVFSLVKSWIEAALPPPQNKEIVIEVLPPPGSNTNDG